MLSYLINGTFSDPASLGNPFQKAIADYYYLVEPKMRAHWDKAVTAELYGFKDKLKYEPVNDFLLLGLLLSLAYLEKADNDFGTPCPEPLETLADDYKFECVTAYFKCYGFDVNKAIKAFGLNTAISTGIGFMAIEVDNCETNIFIVA